MSRSVKKTFGKAIAKVGFEITQFSRRYYKPPPPKLPKPKIPLQEKRVRPWYKVNGDKTLRLDYDLGSDSVVFDVGGYEGQWASDLFSKYQCHIHVFEPVPQYARAIEQRFKRNPKIQLHRFGIAETNKKVDLIINEASSSSYRGKGENISIQLKPVEWFLKKYKINHVDLMKLNIEGAEYDLLEHMLKVGLVPKVSNFQIQFHDFAPNAERRMRTIQRELSKTHHLTYQFRYVWENWERNQ
jgi:FkbM family methyltransferase